MHRMNKQFVDNKSIAFTDDWSGYSGLFTDKIVKQHWRCNHSESWINFKDPPVSMNIEIENDIKEIKIAKKKELIHIQGIES